jgi:hypothetical protein
MNATYTFVPNRISVKSNNLEERRVKMFSLYKVNILDPKLPPIKICKRYTVLPEGASHRTIGQLLTLDEAKALIKTYLAEAYSDGLAELLMKRLEKELSETNNAHAYTEELIESSTLYIQIETES